MLILKDVWRSITMATILANLFLAGCTAEPIHEFAAPKAPGTHRLCTPLSQPPFSSMAKELQGNLGAVLADDGDDLVGLIKGAGSKMTTTVDRLKTRLTQQWEHSDIQTIQWNVRTEGEGGPVVAVELVVVSSKNTRKTPTVHINFWVDRHGEHPTLVPTERYFFINDEGNIHACSEDRSKNGIVPTGLTKRHEDRQDQLWHSVAGVASLHGVSHGKFASTEVDHLQRAARYVGIIGILLDNCCETTEFGDLAPLRMTPGLGILALNNLRQTYDLTPLSDVPDLSELRVSNVAGLSLSKELRLESLRTTGDVWLPIANISHRLHVQRISSEDVEVDGDKQRRSEFQTVLKNTGAKELVIKCKGDRCLPSILGQWLVGTGITELHIMSSVAGAPSDTPDTYGIRGLAVVKSLEVLTLGCNRVRDLKRDAPFRVRLVDAEYLLRNLPHLNRFEASLLDGFNTYTEDPTTYLEGVVSGLDHEVALHSTLACSPPTKDGCDCPDQD